jgi:hypothetical protein
MDFPLGPLLFYGPVAVGLSAVFFAYRLAFVYPNRRKVIAAMLSVCGIAIMSFNPIVNMVIFGPLAPHGYVEKIGSNQQYRGESVDALVRAKGIPNRVLKAQGEERWYYDVCKPFFVIEMDELEFIVKNGKVVDVGIDSF